MKNNQKIMRVQLKIDQDDESFLFGLVSAEPDYKLSLLLNNRFRIALKNTNPVRINNNSGDQLSFSRFSDVRSTTGIQFSLMSNRSGRYFLLNKLKNVDYIFLIHDPEKETIPANITEQLREVEAVSAVFNIDLNVFKDKNLQYLTQ